MTQGTRASDTRTNVEYYAGPYGGWQTALIGENFTKSWVGNDWGPDRKKEEHAYQMSCSTTKDSLVKGWHDEIFGGYNHVQCEFPASWFTNFGPIPLEFDNNNELKILAKLGDKARSHSFNGANFIAECHQPIKMIADISTSLAATLYGLRKGDFTRVSEILDAAKEYGKPYTNARSKEIKKLMTVRSRSEFFKDVKNNIISEEEMAARVLQYQYGIKPLLSDMHDGAEAISRVNNDKYFLNGLQMKVKAKRTISATDTSYYASGITSRSRVIRCTLRAVLKARPDYLTLLHVNDPLSAGWEVMPWSFVADWVLPIGTWLQSLDTVRSFEWGDCWRTLFEEIENKFVALQGDISGGVITLGDGASLKFVNVSRQIYPIGLSTFTPPLPEYKSGIVPEHWLNGISLLIGAKSNIAKTLKY